MNLHHRQMLSMLCGLSLTMGLALPALAGLGGDAASIAADSLALGATVQAAPRQGYVVHEFTTGTGIKIREYLGGADQVFAVTWSGPVMPDLALLLGSHFAAYEQALALPRGGSRKALGIDTPGLVLESGGHLRAYVGRAYVPALLPAGLAPAEVR